MISIEINGTEFKHFNNANVSWRFDSIASTFSFDLYFDPLSENQRNIFKPGEYLEAKVKYNNKTIITGEILSHKFNSGSTRSSVSISGYSRTGVLEDCDIPKSAYPLQVNGQNILQIAEKIAGIFELNVVVESTDISQKFIENLKKKYTKVTAKDNENCNSFLSELANQRQIVLSHTSEGDLLLTESRANAEPMHHFENTADGFEMSLSFNGQKMHSEITMNRQQSKTNNQKGSASATNPYVNSYRPASKRQSSGDNITDTSIAVRNALGEELKAIELSISCYGWDLGGITIEPNTIITVTNPDLFLYNKTKWFVESVNYKGDSKQETTEIKCFLPECYNQDEPINIFQ